MKRTHVELEGQTIVGVASEIDVRLEDGDPVHPGSGHVGIRLRKASMTVLELALTLWPRHTRRER